MCYDIKASLEAQKSRVERSGNLNAAGEIEVLLRKHSPIARGHVNGFEHPILGLYTSQQPDEMSLGRWGLIPHWFQATPQDLKFNTLNARSESMFDKAAFAQAAEQHRGILMVDGFYEHQHRSTGIYPYFIYRKDQKPMALACICEPLTSRPQPLHERQSDQFFDSDIDSDIRWFSFSIVTIKANDLMSEIHNNPKLKQGRMPLILTPEMEEHWLEPVAKNSDAFTLSRFDGGPPQGLSEQFTQQSQEIELEAHTVASLGKKTRKVSGNRALQHGTSNKIYDASAPFEYPELRKDWDLFSGLS